MATTVLPASEANKAERELCAAILKGTIKAADVQLRAADFSDSLCRDVFTACLSLEAAGKSCDLVTVCDALPGREVDVTDVCQEAGFSRMIALQHADIIRARALRRDALRCVMDAANQLSDPLSDVDGVCTGMRAQLDQRLALGITTPTEDLATSARHVLEEREDEHPPTVTSGIEKLDIALGGGFRPAEMVVIGARPSVGKSSLLLYSALHAAADGKKALYISAEMPIRQNAVRALAAVSGVEMRQFSHAERLTDAQRREALRGLEAYGAGNIHQYMQTSIRVPDVRRLALNMRRSGGLDAIYIDYLGLLRSERESENTNARISDISRAIKALACELQIPVIVAAQLNRNAARQDEEPMLHELRDSGSIEQDADIVLLLHALDSLNSDRDERKLLLILAKQRNGPLIKTKLLLRCAQMRFVQLPPDA